eukprot:scaffold1302_cov64-Phaeocystis_antarctica.AAC.2
MAHMGKKCHTVRAAELTAQLLNLLCDVPFLRLLVLLFQVATKWLTLNSEPATDRTAAPLAWSRSTPLLNQDRPSNISARTPWPYPLLMVPPLNCA